jgi:hypothetical protein
MTSPPPDDPNNDLLFHDGPDPAGPLELWQQHLAQMQKRPPSPIRDYYIESVLRMIAAIETDLQ